MGAGVQVAVGIVGGVAMFAVGAAFVGRAEGAVRAVAALGLSALGLMLLADLLVAAGSALPPSRSYVPLGMLVGGASLALLALPLMLMGNLTGLAWAGGRHGGQRGSSDFAVLGLALVAQVAGGALAIVSAAGIVPAIGLGGSTTVFAASCGLGTLAAALIAFWAVPIVRHGARQRRRVTVSGPPV